MGASSRVRRHVQAAVEHSIAVSASGEGFDAAADQDAPQQEVQHRASFRLAGAGHRRFLGGGGGWVYFALLFMGLLYRGSSHLPFFMYTYRRFYCFITPHINF